MMQTAKPIHKELSPLDNMDTPYPLAPRSGPFWPLVLLITLGATVARYFYTMSATGGEFERLLYPDEINYYIGGARLILEQGLGYFSSVRSLWNAPLYPAIIAALDVNVAAVKWMNLVAVFLASLLSADAARRLAGRKAGILAALFCATFHPFAVFGGTALSEPIFTLLFTSSLWCIIASPRRALAAGLLMGCAALVRPTVQYLPLLGLVGALFIKPKELRRQLILFSSGIALIVGPVIARNYLLFGLPSIATGSGAVMYLGNDLRRDGNEPLYSFMDFDTARHTAPHTHLDKEGDAALRQKAIERMKDHPVESLTLFIRKVLRFTFGDFRAYFFPYDEVGTFLVHQTRSGALRTEYEIILRVVLGVGVLFGLAFLSLPISVKVLSGGVFGYMILSHAALFAIPRMFLPLIPFCAAVTSAYLLRRDAHWKPLMGIVSVAVILVINLYGVFWDLRVVDASFTKFFSQKLTFSPEVGSTQFRIKGLEAEGEGYRIRESESYIEFLPSPFQSEANSVVFIQMEIQTPDSNPNRWGAGSLAWRNSQGVYSQTHRRDFPIQYDGIEHIYMVPLGLVPEWGGEVGGIRLILPSDSVGAFVKVAGISVAD